MLRPTFLGFKTASSALRVSQALMDVTGQNMANSETKGYTRQRLDINSVSINARNLKYGLPGPVIGQGVTALGNSQYRDPFLDLKYRAEAAKAGGEGVKLDALGDIEAILDEITKDGLGTQFSDLAAQLQSLTQSPSDPVLEGVVRTSASLLCQIFNNASKKIDTVEEQQEGYLKEGAITDVNSLLSKIADLNKQIRENNVGGNPALELNDTRNLMIDELSSYMDIEVKVTPVTIGPNKTVDELKIILKGDGANIELVNDKDFAQLDVKNKTDSGGNEIKGVDIKLSKSIDASFPADTLLTDIIDKGQLSGYLNFLNGKGEFADTSDGENSFRGVQYYRGMLDTLANTFAKLMNEANSIVDTADPTKNQDKPLFEAKDKVSGITAGNISISQQWKESTSYITNTKAASDPKEDTTGATDNIARMIALIQTDKHSFDASGVTGGAVSTPLFKGTLQEFFSYSVLNLNLEIKSAQNSFDMYSETQYQLDYARSSISSVDFDEEGINMLTFSKSYNAAARLMTVLDDMLDTLINKMAV